MIFIGLGKLKKKPNKAFVDDTNKVFDELQKKGIKFISRYWTLGRYDVVLTYEAANEKEALKVSLALAEFGAMETLVAIPREEATKLV